jgi:Tol biopolymer transport system component
MKRTVTSSQSLGVIGFDQNWSPSGEWVVYIDRERYSVHLINPRAPQEHKVFFGISGEAPQWTAKGNSVLVVWGWKIMEINCTEAKSFGEASYVESRRRVVFELENHSHTINEFCRSGSKLAFVLNKSSVYTIDINGNRSRLLADGFDSAHSLSWSPDESYLACCKGEIKGAVTLLDPTTGQIKNIHHEAYQTVWSPVDPLLAFDLDYHEEHDAIGIFNSATQKTFVISLDEHLLTKRKLKYYPSKKSLIWSPNGKLLCCIISQYSRFRGERETRALCIVDVESRKIRNIIELSTHSFSPPTWSPDGTSVVVNLSPGGILHVIKV